VAAERKSASAAKKVDLAELEARVHRAELEAREAEARVRFWEAKARLDQVRGPSPETRTR
jgi:hypothetical protein